MDSPECAELPPPQIWDPFPGRGALPCSLLRMYQILWAGGLVRAAPPGLAVVYLGHPKLVRPAKSIW
ncbi:hypothetical protein [Streptomyces sp. NPDC008121]|uniref:hypothetical protein n=1 Tax=Streptomyces sp. NPDC008121 TaxID=3364809 RepID=UPI0036E1A35E